MSRISRGTFFAVSNHFKNTLFLNQLSRIASVSTIVGSTLLWSTQSVATDLPNTCPVDGCEVSIEAVAKADGELSLTLDSNFTPDNSKNHFHMWWGEQYKPEQVGRNAKSEYGAEQGKWHRHDDYPVYITTGSASVEVREGSTTLCVTAADGDHNVLDAQKFHCMDVSAYL